MPGHAGAGASARRFAGVAAREDGRQELHDEVGPDRAAAEVDHIQPVIDGGTDDASNLRLLCDRRRAVARCSSAKTATPRVRSAGAAGRVGDDHRRRSRLRARRARFIVVSRGPLREVSSGVYLQMHRVPGHGGLCGVVHSRDRGGALEAPRAPRTRGAWREPGRVVGTGAAADQRPDPRRLKSRSRHLYAACPGAGGVLASRQALKAPVSHCKQQAPFCPPRWRQRSAREPAVALPRLPPRRSAVGLG